MPSDTVRTAPAVVDPLSMPVRWSRLKYMAQSPAHYLHALQTDKEPTPAMKFGTLVHRHVLGGEDVAVYEGQRRGNAWADFEAEHAGSLIVTAAEDARARRCAEALRAHPIASNILVGNLEKEVSWKIGARACQGHIDAAGFTWVSELKTSTCAQPDWFRRHALSLGYHAQLAWYQDALALLGRHIGAAYIAVVETQAPHLVTVFTLSPRAIEEGRKLNRIWWERLMVCEASRSWPGYVEHEVPLDVAAEGVVLRLPDGEEIAA